MKKTIVAKETLSTEAKETLSSEAKENVQLAQKYKIRNVSRAQDKTCNRRIKIEKQETQRKPCTRRMKKGNRKGKNLVPAFFKTLPW